MPKTRDFCGTHENIGGTHRNIPQKISGGTHENISWKYPSGPHTKEPLGISGKAKGKRGILKLGAQVSESINRGPPLL